MVSVNLSSIVMDRLTLIFTPVFRGKNPKKLIEKKVSSVNPLGSSVASFKGRRPPPAIDLEGEGPKTRGPILV